MGVNNKYTINHCGTSYQDLCSRTEICSDTQREAQHATGGTTESSQQLRATSHHYATGWMLALP
jgi:hypothetical protein